MNATLMANRNRIAASAPIRLSNSPSTRNGSRIRQLVAPTSFMIPISLRRANRPIRTVFAIRIDADTSITNATSSTTDPEHPGDREQPVQERALVDDLVDPGLPRSTAATCEYFSGLPSSPEGTRGARRNRRC